MVILPIPGSANPVDRSVEYAAVRRRQEQAQAEKKRRQMYSTEELKILVENYACWQAARYFAGEFMDVTDQYPQLSGAYTFGPDNLVGAIRVFEDKAGNGFITVVDSNNALEAMSANQPSLESNHSH